MSRGDRCQRRSSPVTGSFPDVCYVAQFTVGGALDRHQSTNYSSLALCKTVVNGNRPSCSHRFHLRLRRRRPGIPSSAAASRMSLPHTSLFRVCVVVNVIESPGEKKGATVGIPTGCLRIGIIQQLGSRSCVVSG